ncbi:MAG: hypothetical protein AABZ30_12660, partial [Myxococcota bacterium]
AESSLTLSVLEGDSAIDLPEARREAALIGEPGAALAKVAKATGARVVILGDVAEEAGAVQARLWLYDARRQLISGTAGGVIGSRGDADAIVRRLLGADPFGEAVLARPAAAAGPGLVARVRAWPNYWDVVGLGATLVTIGAVVAVVVLATPEEQDAGGLSPGGRRVVLGF